MWETVYVDDIYISSSLSSFARIIISIIILTVFLLIIRCIKVKHEETETITALIIITLLTVCIIVYFDDKGSVYNINDLSELVNESDVETVITGDATIVSTLMRPYNKKIIINGNTYYLGDEKPGISVPTGDFTVKMFITERQEVARLDIWRIE